MLVCVVLNPNVWAKLEQKVLYTSAWYKWHLTWIACAITEKCSISSKCLIPLKDAQLQASPWQESSTFSRWSLRSRWNWIGTACPSQTQKGFPCCIRRLEWCAFHRKKELVGSIEVSQERAIEELEEIPAEKNIEEDLHCTPTMHTRYRRLLGQNNWVQSGTQFQCVASFQNVLQGQLLNNWWCKSSNKLAGQLQSQPVKLQFWPLTGSLRIIGFLDSSYRNNEDGSSQRGMTVSSAELREHSAKDWISYGSIVNYESQKIKRKVLSTTVAEMYSFMKSFVSCQFLRGLWMDMSGEVAEIHMRTDAKNLVTTARTIPLPEQKETIHMISMLRNETCSGSIHDLARISTRNC